MKNKPVTKETMRKVLLWMANGRTGVSSKTIASYICTGEKVAGSTPLDPSDFNRCLMLIKAVPELKDHLHKMKTLDVKWVALVDNWDSLEECFINEVGENWSKGDSAPITYAAMKGMGL